METWKTARKALETAAEAWQRAASEPRFIEACAKTCSETARWLDPSRWLEAALLGRGARIGATPFRVVWRWGPSSLRRYEPSKRGGGPPLLIVYAMVNRPYVLDLLPGRSVVARMLAAGVPVYLLDWGAPGRVEAELPLESFIEDVLGGAVAEVRRRERGARVALLGYCQGGTLALEYALRHPGEAASLTLLAAPVDFAQMGLLGAWSRGLDPEALRDESGNVPGVRLYAAFEALRPFGAALRWTEVLDRLSRGEADEDAREHFVAMERWIADAVDHPGRAFAEFVRTYYHANALLPRVCALRRPLMCVVGGGDHLVPPPSTLAALERAGSRVREQVRCDCGHIGLSVGRRAHAEVWPRVIDWMRRHS